MPTRNDERRGAERHAPPKPVPATFAGFDVKILDIGFLGCRIEHVDRLPPRARTTLRFSWRGAQVRVEATAVRTELTSRGGKPAYISGLQFCESVEASPAVVRDIVGWLVAAAKSSEPPATHAAPPAVATASEDEPEVIAAPYLRCSYVRGEWSNVFVDDPAQPEEGFTIFAPADEKEAVVLRRAYEQAGAEKRRSMRVTIEREMARRRPGSAAG